ncbi:hypothetical protein [Leadbettera azotonutricia]|uniref:Uncharacterized protein n=1 Tax=Leadbettera azotonutricia (strain ATCC BAA-888 / DSM 13862 / ZAS-9) TaxID=545695 RepID=F5YAX1_LEAAZ|nr:hypothetical protein [Leadbettera azotonutricia]AEF80202.1 hypothetical protein TREAZ_0658 [Leadbettera azotonutricia ZAS-9]
MYFKRLGALISLLALASFPLYASMISFLVVETGLSSEGSAGEYSALWEDGLMSAFFDAGHIVSNGHILRLEKNPSKVFPDEVEDDYYEAAAGGADYFVIALLEYKSQNGKYRPSGISVRVFNIESTDLVYQQNFAAGTGASLKEESTNAREAARAIIPHLKDR